MSAEDLGGPGQKIRPEDQIYNMKRITNILSAIRSRYVTVTKMIPLTDKIRMSLYDPLCYNIALSAGRLTHLAWRIRQTSLFLTFVLKYNKDHGSKSTVRWLKASLVAIQKELGQDRLDTLHALTPDLAYSKTAGGLPRIIPASDRGKIRKGDVSVIRFWTGLFNLYRVLKVPGDLKLQTITDPFSGHLFEIIGYTDVLKRGNFFFDNLERFSKVRSANLVPDRFILSRSASPSNKMSCLGILTDIHLLNKYNPELWQEILYYLHSVGTKVSSPFLQQLENGYQLVLRLVGYDGKVMTGVKSGNKLVQYDHLMTKNSIRIHGLGPGKGLSQFAIKEEPAGKIRLFALMDSITQSALSPLHDAMFDLLRLIPNDGTFDQEASIKRSQSKAVESGKAFSFDLTAATDRLPAFFTAILIEEIFKKDGMAESWLNLMTGRPFAFNGQIAGKLKVSEGPYHYAVGQPMGGLSSWAGLAITHHWIVQQAAYRVTGAYSWNTQYEILGDDLVIFNEEIADEYLRIMASFGCEINLHKSIVSRNRPVFEFAKRTCWGMHIVSGISMAQVRAGWRVAGRVANALSFSNSGLLTSPRLLAITLSKYAFSKGIANVSVGIQKGSDRAFRLFSLGILSLLGTLYQSGKIPLKVLMTALVNPNYSEADYSGEAVGLPHMASLNAAFSKLVDASAPVVTPTEIVWSKQEARDEVFDEYSSELVAITLQAALAKAKTLLEKYELYVQEFASRTHFRAYYENESKWVETRLPITVPLNMVNDYIKEKYPSGKYQVKLSDTPEEWIIESRLEMDMINVDINDYPSDYKLLLIQIENFYNWCLGLEFAREDPEWLYETIYDLAYKQAKWSNMTFEDASAWLTKVEALEFKLTLKEPAAPGKTILESAPILSALRQMDPKIVKTKFERPYWEGPMYKSLYQLSGVENSA